MRSILAIARREIGAYFGSPIGWICLCAFVSIAGFFFFVGLISYESASADAVFNPYAADQMNVNEYIVQPFFGNLTIIALLISPALSMRLIAEDRRNRSIELLLTSPITSVQIVAGKFLGALGFAAALMLGTLPYLGILYWLGEPDTGLVLANYGGFMLLFGTFMAVGLAASALTENQIVALVLSFSVCLILYLMGWMVQGASDGALKTVIEYVSMTHHFEEVSKGLLHTKDLVYFGTFIGLCLFAATQRVEALRWR